MISGDMSKKGKSAGELEVRSDADVEIPSQASRKPVVSWGYPFGIISKIGSPAVTLFLK